MFSRESTQEGRGEEEMSGYGPVEELKIRYSITKPDGFVDIELLTVILLELRERIKELEEKCS